MAAVELREVDEPLFGHRRGRRGHRAPVELVHAARERGAAPARQPEAVSGAPAIRAHEQLAPGSDVLANERTVTLEPSGREEERVTADVFRTCLPVADLP